MPDLPDEPDTNEPIPTPTDGTGVVSGDEKESTSPSELPSPEVDPAIERDPKGERPPGDPPGDLDDGPLVAMNANRPSEG